MDILLQLVPGLTKVNLDKEALLQSMSECAWLNCYPQIDHAALCNYISLYSLPAGKRIFAEGDEYPFICILHKGSVSIVKESSAGEDQLLGTLQQGQLLGEISLLDNSSRTASAITAEHTEMFIISGDSFTNLRKNNPTLSEKLLSTFINTLTRRLRHTDGKFADLSVEYGALEQRTQQELLKKNLELHDALAKAQESNRLKDEFLATISHELRTPMNGIEGALNLLKRDELDSRHHQIVEVALQSAGSMTCVVEMLLEFAELQAGSGVLLPEALTLEPFLSGFVATFQRRCEDKQLSLKHIFSPTLPKVVLIDPNRLSLLLNQILDNAVKFTHHGEVSFTASAYADNNKKAWLELKITDTGIGIANEHLLQLFEGFRQVDGRFNRQYGGLGIGLSTSRKIIELMKGSIKIDSALNEGTEVRILIPLNVIAENASNIVGPGIPLDQATVLIVEDNPVNQLIIQKIVSGFGARTLLANDGIEALSVLQANITSNQSSHGETDRDSHERINLILMDCQMPRMNGYEASAAIRSLPAPYSNIPIIAVTANAMGKDRNECIASGMNDYLKKPVDRIKLKSKMERWL